MDAARAVRTGGDTVLELAAGVGDTGFDAAAIVGEQRPPDLAPTSRRRCSRPPAAAAPSAASRNVDYRVIDAEQIELDDRFGRRRAVPLRLHADGRSRPRRSPRHAASCARGAAWRWPSGGRWSRTRSSRSSRSASSSTATCRRPSLRARRSSAWPAPSAPTALLEGAGFAGVRTEEVPVRFAVADVDDYLSLISDTAGPLGLALRALSETRPRGGQGATSRARSRASRSSAATSFRASRSARRRPEGAEVSRLIQGFECDLATGTRCGRR